MLVSAAGIEPATHALKELISPVFPITSKLLRDCQTLESTNKVDQSWVIAVGDLSALAFYKYREPCGQSGGYPI
jgi:hypothetical protein